ncbi:MAG TPA: cysteine--tRNA ligase [Phycisphaerales bacterium]|nr:cysteine--tRNA ligase [Phycisphaerales bacterium]HCD34661.1 cysteine--tRNA ligase [Phycisphaerales bacterium]|tara:strand:+ start:55 stop:1554 length:1500 start_codon:yes stop_codon:yes gene_type:complete
MALNIRFHNTLTNQTDTFTPNDAPLVRMYSCGPTVYDYAHIGNFRTFIFADVLRRFLELVGYDVKHVMNITDVGHMTEDDLADGGGEDKMELAARRIKEDKKSGRVPEGVVQNPDDPYQIANYYTQAFLADAKTLGMKVAFEYPQSMPHATNCIDIMQDMITRLLENGHAYQTDDGVVYFSVESFPDYGKLSGNTLDKLRGGAGGRIDEQTMAGKRHPGDFLLWKPDEKHIMKWDSPWGRGYPGWHIECSCMAQSLLGSDVIDIHTGGEDLTFPHHECEIAQSRGASGKDSFAKFWMHARFLLVDGQKMSKSKGSFYTARDVFDGKVTGRSVHPAVLRFELMRSHYRSNLNFTASSLSDAGSAVKRFTDFALKAKSECNDQPAEIDLNHTMLAAFTQALADDLNISGALGELFAWINDGKDDAPIAWAACLQVDRVLGLLDLEDQSTSEVDIDALCKALDDARATKDYASADELRKQMVDAGYDVLTTKEGTKAVKKLA